MKDNLTTAKECGQRLRRIRMARNMSQQELADLLFTTPQNISKYEKEGINSIDTIIKINELLECNLLKDEIDVEGTIGEIGKEILCVLVEHNGFIEISSLVETYMHGLNENQITKEVIKLENIGLCVREQYVGHYNDKHDGLFITAKGIISLKNNLNPGIASLLFDKNRKQRNFLLEEDVDVEEMVREVSLFTKKATKLETYEQRVLAQGYETYQELLDQLELQRLVCKLPLLHTSYKANYILYLKNNYIDYDWLGKNQRDNFAKSFFDSFLSSENVYIDILHRMIRKLDNKKLDSALETLEMQGYTEEEDHMDNIQHYLTLKYSPKYEFLRNEDKTTILAGKYFAGQSEWYKEYLGEQLSEFSLDVREFENLDRTLFSDEDLEMARQLDEYQSRADQEIEAIEATFDWHLAKWAEQKESKLVTDWFTKEEVLSFINTNLGLAVSEKEKQVDMLLAEIHKKYPETLEYFQFPAEWEENGLAALIRKNFGIETN